MLYMVSSFLHVTAQHLNLKRYGGHVALWNTTIPHTHTHRKLLLGRITERTFVEVRKVIS